MAEPQIQVVAQSAYRELQAQIQILSDRSAGMVVRLEQALMERDAARRELAALKEVKPAGSTTVETDDNHHE